VTGLPVRVLFFIACVSALLSAQSNPVPFVNQALSPASAAPGSPGFTLAISGTGFASGAVAEWNGSSRLTEVVSSSLLQVTIKTSDLAKAGTGSIKVVNPAPGGGASNVVFFQIRKPFTALAMVGNDMFVDASSVAVGDFNHDGKLDVFWTVGTTANVSLGNGDGTFQAPIASAGSYASSEAITGDFNGDGNLDVATTDGSGNGSVYLGNGDGTLTFKTVFQSGVSVFTQFIATADFNGDGKLDIYMTGSDLGAQWFQIFLGNGDGTFTPLAENWVDFNGGYYSPAIGDFNGDGILDLAVPEGYDVAIYLGNGDGTFHQVGTVYAARWWVTAADMNRDGKLDLVGDYGCAYLGNGDGTFSIGGCGEYGGQVIGAGDFNGDGNLDVSFVEQGIGAAVTLGTGTGSFSGGAMIPAGNPTIRTGAAIGDFNNDGMLDLVTGNGFLLLQTTASVLPTSLAFGNQNVGTKSSPQIVTLTNVGTSTLVIGKVGISGTDAKDFSFTNGCGTSLNAESSCTISVVFAPKVGGALSATVSVSYQGVGSPQQVSLSGTGIAPPTVTLTPSNLTFAAQLVGTTSAAQTATLTNTGNQVVSISGVSMSGAFSETNDCPSSLGIGMSCQVQIEFQPTGVGPASGTLSISDGAAGSPQKVGLQGTGTVIQILPLSVNFGNQKVGTVSSPAPITVTNTGSSVVTISSIGFTGTDSGDFLQTNNCGKNIASHSSCTINVRFKPAATGARSASLNVNDNGGASPQSVPLSGTGT